MTTLFIAFREISHDRRRIILNVVALAAVAFVYLILTALSQTLGSLNREASLSNNLIMVDGEMIDPSDASLNPAAVEAIDDYIPELISRTSPTMFRHLRLNGRMIQLRAAHQADWQAVHHIYLVAGNWPNGTSEIVISEGAAAVGGWTIGDQLTIYGRSMTISGLVQFEGMAFATIFLDLPAAQDLFGTDRGYQFVIIAVTPGVDANQIRDQLESDARIGEYTDVLFEDDYTLRNAQALKDVETTASALSAIALLAAVLGVYNATGLSLIEKQRQIGILRSVGFAPGSIRWILITQAMAQAAIGFSIGLLLVLIFSVIQGSGRQLYAFGWPLRFVVTPVTASIGLLLMLVLSAAAALLAARTVLATSPSEAIRI